MSIESDVRGAAAKLHEAITAAHAAGYRVQLPQHIDGLRGIAISETSKVYVVGRSEPIEFVGLTRTAPEPAEKPMPTFDIPRPKKTDRK